MLLLTIDVINVLLM